MPTQAQMLTAIRDRVNEPTAAFWSDVNLRRWVNEIVTDIARRTECFRATTTVAVVANTATYTPAFTPGQPVREHLVEFVPTGSSSRYELQRRDRNAMGPVWGSWQGVSRGWPGWYTTWDSPPALAFQLYPTPGVAGTLHIFYYRHATVLATDGTATASNVDVVSGWDDLVADGVEYKALRADADPRWQEAKQEYEQHIMALSDAALRYSDQAGLMIADTGALVPTAWMYGDGY